MDTLVLFEYFGKCGNFSSVNYIKLKLLFIFNNETNEVKLNSHFHDSNVTRDTDVYSWSVDSPAVYLGHT